MYVPSTGIDENRTYVCMYLPGEGLELGLELGLGWKFEICSREIVIFISKNLRFELVRSPFSSAKIDDLHSVRSPFLSAKI